MSKNRPGRPLVETAKKRKIRKELLFTENEIKILNTRFEHAKPLYKDINSMIRDQIFNQQIKLKYSNFDSILLGKNRSEINKIGNNFNQLLKKINSNKSNYVSNSELIPLLRNISNLLQKNIEILNKNHDS